MLNKYRKIIDGDSTFSWKLQKVVLNAFDHHGVIVLNTFYDFETQEEREQGTLLFKVNDYLYKDIEGPLFRFCHGQLMENIELLDKSLEIIHDYEHETITITNLNRELKS